MTEGGFFQCSEAKHIHGWGSDKIDMQWKRHEKIENRLGPRAVIKWKTVKRKELERKVRKTGRHTQTRETEVTRDREDEKDHGLVRKLKISALLICSPSWGLIDARAETEKARWRLLQSILLTSALCMYTIPSYISVVSCFSSNTEAYLKSGMYLFLKEIMHKTMSHVLREINTQPTFSHMLKESEVKHLRLLSMHALL